MGVHEGDAYVRPTAELSMRRASPDQSRSLFVSGSAGFISVDPPAQRMFVLGGTNTLPGYDYRTFAGRWYGLVKAEATHALLDPWINLRVIGAAGAAAGLPAPPAVPSTNLAAWRQWNVTDTDGVRTSLGAGASLLWDLLRIDVVRGLNGGSWQLQVSFHRDFWDIS
jgi:hypothetical protein